MTSTTRHNCPKKGDWVQWNKSFYGPVCPYGCQFVAGEGDN